MPILIAGGGEQKMLRVVARHADIWNTFAEGEDLVRKLGLLDRYCAEIGRDPSTIERSVHVGGDPWQNGPAASRARRQPVHGLHQRPRLRPRHHPPLDRLARRTERLTQWHGP